MGVHVRIHVVVLHEYNKVHRHTTSSKAFAPRSTVTDPRLTPVYVHVPRAIVCCMSLVLLFIFCKYSWIYEKD